AERFTQRRHEIGAAHLATERVGVSDRRSLRTSACTRRSLPPPDYSQIGCCLAARSSAAPNGRAHPPRTVSSVPQQPPARLAPCASTSGAACSFQLRTV